MWTLLYRMDLDLKAFSCETIGIESINFGDSNYEKLLPCLNKGFFTYG